MVNKPTYKIHTIVLRVNQFRYDDKQKMFQLSGLFSINI